MAKKDQDNPFGLTAKQQLFCSYYIKSFNATMSYIQAYGVKYETALGSGPRLLGNERVRNEIKRLKELSTKAKNVDKNDILNEFIKIAFADIGDYVKYYSKEEVIYNQFGQPIINQEGEVKRIRNYVEAIDSNKVDTSLISEISSGKNGFKIKLHDKLKALDRLAEYFGITEESEESKEFKKFVVEYVKDANEKKDDVNGANKT